SFTVTDANGCASSTGITIAPGSGGASELMATAVAGSIACYGGTTTVIVTASGGIPPYSGTGVYTQGAGNFAYTVMDNSGCSTSASGSVNEPAPLIVTGAFSPYACSPSTPTIQVEVTGGTAPYSSVYSFAPLSGDCTYTVTDSQGCATTTVIPR
ncbi:MAG: hypothetical protein RL021_2084, partial [Bacteroidota bacterium]